MYQKGKFWVVQNFAAADHGQLECHSAVTLTTIADIGHLNNLVPLVRSWRAPISLTLYAPGEDLHPTLDSIIYLRNCLRNTEDSNMMRELVSFHLIFDLNHVTQDVSQFYLKLKFTISNLSHFPVTAFFQGGSCVLRAQSNENVVVQKRPWFNLLQKLGQERCPGCSNHTLYSSH